MFNKRVSISWSVICRHQCVRFMQFWYVYWCAFVAS